MAEKMESLAPIKSGRHSSVPEGRRGSYVTSLNGDVPNIDGLTADEAALVALGYKQEFKREFSLWTTFCVSFAVLGLLPSFASTLYYGMGYAGTGGMVWGWLISWIFIQCVAMGMAELCSSMPTRYVSFTSLGSGHSLMEAQRRLVLCCRSIGTTWVWTIRSVDNWLVELDGTSDRCAFGRLCAQCHDPRSSLDHESVLRPNRVSDLPPDRLRDTYPRLHFQHADPLDRAVQLIWLDTEYDCASCGHNHDSSECDRIGDHTEVSAK
jgi:hypothetical protein